MFNFILDRTNKIEYDIKMSQKNKRIYVGNVGATVFQADSNKPWIYFIEPDGKEYAVHKNGETTYLGEGYDAVSTLVNLGSWPTLTNEQVAAFRPELVESMDSNYIGLVTSSVLKPFNNLIDSYDGAYVLLVDGNYKLYAYYLESGKKEALEGWGEDGIKTAIEDGDWKHFTNLEIEELMAKYRKAPVVPTASITPQTKVKYVGLHNPPTTFGLSDPYVLKVEDDKVSIFYLSGSSKERFLFNTSSGRWKDHYQKGWFDFTPEAFQTLFKTNDIKTQSQPPASMAKISKPSASKAPLIVKKGSLYFNITTKQVERVITVQDTSLIWSSKHKQEVKAYPRSAFRLATHDEVDAYLSAANL